MNMLNLEALVVLKTVWDGTHVSDTAAMHIIRIP